MTLPNAPDEGFTPGPLHALTAISPKVGYGSIPQLPDWTQEYAQDVLKAMFVRDNPAINTPLAQVYAGLRQGISFPLAVLEALTNRLRGTSTMFLSLEHVLTSLGSWLDDTMFATGDQAEQYPPYTPPFTPTAVSQAVQMFALLRRFLAWGDIAAPGFDFNTAVRNTIATLLAQNMLAQLVDGKVPVEQIPEDLLELFRKLVDLITPDVTPPTAPGALLTAAWDAFFRLFGITSTAQSQAATAATQAAANTAAINAASDPTFTSVTDLEFNTAPTTNISGNYTTLYTPGAGGTLAADGLGSVIWSPSGGSERTGYARHITELNTDNFELQLILDEAIPAPVAGGQSYVWILARIKADLSSFTAVRIGYNTLTVGDALASGTFVARGAPQPITSTAGDSWIFRGGYSDATHGPWRLKAFQNNLTRENFMDTGHNSNVGALYRGVGFGYTAGARDGNTAQLVPPKLLSFTASDRSPSAA